MATLDIQIACRVVLDIGFEYLLRVIDYALKIAVRINASLKY